MVTAKYLNNDNYNFLSCRKNHNASLAWKNILDSRDIIKKGLKWSLGNGEDINFWMDKWLTDSSLLDYVHPDNRDMIDITKKVRDIIDHSTTHSWITHLIHNYLPQDIINILNNTPMHVTNIKDKIIWKYNSTGQFSVKSTTWVNNSDIPFHRKAKFLNDIWKLRLRPKLQLFAWKLVRDTFQPGVS